MLDDISPFTLENSNAAADKYFYRHYHTHRLEEHIKTHVLITLQFERNSVSIVQLTFTEILTYHIRKKLVNCTKLDLTAILGQ